MFHLEWPPFFHCIWSTWNDGITTFSHCIIHVEWWNDHLFPIVYKIHVKWLSFPVVYGPRGMTTFSYCIWSTWNDHLFPLYMVHVGWPPFPIVYGPRGMTTFSYCIWSTWNDQLFPLYMVHVGWPPFPIVYGPRGMTTFSRSICSTLLTTLWFSCLLQEPTVTLSVLILSPSLSSLPSSGRSSASYSSDEVKSLKDLQ